MQGTMKQVKAAVVPPTSPKINDMFGTFKAIKSAAPEIKKPIIGRHMPSESPPFIKLHLWINTDIICLKGKTTNGKANETTREMK
jgi:hypothetical protein